MKRKRTHSHLETLSSHQKGNSVLWFLTGAIALVSVAALVVYILYEHKTQREYSDIAQSVAANNTTPAPSPFDLTDNIVQAESADDADPLPTATPAPVRIPVDFSYYRSINSDVIGWISVEGTEIDYLVLFDANNYYLNHTYTGKYSSSGSIFIQNYNRADFTDFNTVVYGHNMVSGSMFAQLHKFEDTDFFNEHSSIVIYTPSHKLTYLIFAAYRTDNLHIMANNDFSTPESRTAYIESIYQHTTNAHFDYGVPVTESDRIITLSTCINNYMYRYVVQGLLISDEEGYYME